MKSVHLLLLAVSVFACGESAVVYETDFAVVPPGWYNDNWSTSSSQGAYIHQNMPGGGSPQIYTFLAHMYSNTTPPVWYFVPDGTDSLVIDVEHSIDVFTTSNCNFFIKLLYSDDTEEYIFHQQISGNGGYISTEPIHHVVVGPPEGVWIGFVLYAYNTIYYATMGHIYWYVTSLNATAYGNSLNLEPSTWASIKSALWEY